jgi:hypothetical protein
VRASRGQRAAAKDAQGHTHLAWRCSSVVAALCVVKRSKRGHGCAALVRVRSALLAIGVSFALVSYGELSCNGGLVPHRVASLLASPRSRNTRHDNKSLVGVRDLVVTSIKSHCSYFELYSPPLLFGLFELHDDDPQQNSVVRKTKIPMARMDETNLQQLPTSRYRLSSS